MTQDAYEDYYANMVRNLDETILSLRVTVDVLKSMKVSQDTILTLLDLYREGQMQTLMYGFINRVLIKLNVPVHADNIKKFCLEATSDKMSYWTSAIYTAIIWIGVKSVETLINDIYVEMIGD